MWTSMESCHLKKLEVCELFTEGKSQLYCIAHSEFIDRFVYLFIVNNNHDHDFSAIISDVK